MYNNITIIISFICYFITTLIIGLPILYLTNKEFLVKYFYLTNSIGLFFLIIPLYLLKITNFPHYLWIGIIVLFGFISIYLTLRDKIILTTFTSKKNLTVYFLSFLVYLIYLYPVIKTGIISNIGGGVDYATHIQYALALSIDPSYYKDFPQFLQSWLNNFYNFNYPNGYHLLLAVFKNILPFNILEIFILLNGFIISIFYINLIFFGTQLIKNNINYTFLYFISFVATFNPIIMWTFIDNFSPQLLLVSIIPLILGFILEFIKSKQKTPGF